MTDQPRPDVLPEVASWLRRRSWTAADRPVEHLLAAKRAAGPDGTVSVVLPALDEEPTVGEIVTRIREELMERLPLVDELVVVDSGSVDRTAETARAAGARVVHRDDLLPRVAAAPGKGEVLWRSLLATSGAIVCFVDADLREFDPALVSGIVGPLLTDPGIQLVKAMYDRPLETQGAVVPAGGGRVTELVARPLLNLHWPQLAGFVQPLGASTRRGAACWSGCPSRPATGSSWDCWWTRWRRSGSTRWPRWTWVCGTTGTRTGRHSAGWRRRSTAPRWNGWTAATG
ncbi:hypothetical protein GCM10025734_48510 [Kitasatospora paranensis]